MTATTVAPTYENLTCGTVIVTVKPDPHWRHVRLIGFGEEWHETYTYKLERVEEVGGFTLYLRTWTENARNPNAGRWVYTGIVHPKLGTLRLTTKSAFPLHATRVKVANKVFAALLTGRAADIEKAGWTVDVTVEKELEDRF